MTINVVTGAAGFVGSHLVEALLYRGDRVIGVDHFNDHYNPLLKRTNLAHCLNHPSFQLVEAEIQQIDWSTLLSDVDVVYHQAAQAGVRDSWGVGFRTFVERNINATQTLLEAAKNANLKRLVFASSSSVYGDAETLPTHELICPRPVSPYGITKLAAEQLCLLYHRNFGVPIVALRYFTVYGPRQRPDMAFHKFFKAVLDQQPIAVYGDGQQTRDFTFISDAIAANLAAADATEAIGAVFNIGGGSRVALMEILATIETIVGEPLRREMMPPAAGDARHTAADVSKARNLLGYTPQVALLEGLSREWKWIQSLYNQG